MENYQHVVTGLTMVPSKGGIFDVIANGETIYSKHETGRHAEEGEVLALFTSHVGPDVPRYGDE